PCYVPTRPSAPFTPLFPYTTLFRSLGRGDKNIAWAGNHVDWLQLGIIIAVGQQRNALRATDSPYFIHAQDGAGSQNRRVRKPTEFFLRWGCNNQSRGPGFLGWNGIHNDRRGIHSFTAWYIQPYALDGAKYLRDRRAGTQSGGVGQWLLCRVYFAHALNGDFNSLFDFRVKLLDGIIKRLLRHAQSSRPNAIELFAVIECGCCSAMLNIPDDRRDFFHDGGD